MGRPPKASTPSVRLDLGELNPKQAEFCSSRTLYTAYGGARGGGKTHVLRVKAVGGALRWPGIKILIIRRTYPELQRNHIEPIVKMVPRALAEYNGSLHTMYFSNGSMIVFGHYNGVASETEYQGQEFDWIFLDEATQFTEHEFRILGGCLRGVNEIPKRFYLTCNPGGVGHRWVKRLFIDRDFKTGSENPEENENPNDYSFIFARVEDNTHLMNSQGGEAYKAMLSALPEKMRAAHRYGDWDALGGTYFSEFSEARHVIKPITIEPHWTRYRAFDYGLDMFACYWIAVDEDGRSYVYREFKKSNMIVQDAAKAIHDNTLPHEKIVCTYAPPDMWNRQKDTGKTMAEVFMVNGVGLVRADNNRVQGHLQIKEALANLKDGAPGLKIFENCKELIGDLQAIQADEANPNDCAKDPHDITHSVDALRYYCISRTIKAEAPQSEDFYEEDTTLDDYDDYMTGGAASASYMTY